MAVVALDLGGSKLAGALVTRSGRVQARRYAPLEGRTGAAVGELIGRMLIDLVEFAATKRATVSGVGVSVPGISYQTTGTVWAPNIPGWTRFPLRRTLTRSWSATPAAAAVGVRSSTPIVIDSDRACCVLGETWRGEARGCANVIFLAVGTGIGAGILVDGRLVRGTHGSAGAIGWWALARPFRREYIPCGCFEYHASGAGLEKVAGQRSQPSRRLQTSADVFAAFRQGEPTARRVLGEAVGFWGMAVANLVSLFNPERIVFGGGVFGPAARFLPAIHREAAKWAQPVAMNQVKLSASNLGGDAALYGAAWLATYPERYQPGPASGTAR